MMRDGTVGVALLAAADLMAAAALLGAALVLRAGDGDFAADPTLMNGGTMALLSAIPMLTVAAFGRRYVLRPAALAAVFMLGFGLHDVLTANATPLGHAHGLYAVAAGLVLVQLVLLNVVADLELPAARLASAVTGTFVLLLGVATFASARG